MKFSDKFRFVRQNMKKNKSRVFMTVLATAMGCAFLIVLASVGFGLQKSIVDNIVGDRAVTEISIYGRETGKSMQREFYEDDLAYLRSVKHVKAVTYRNYIRQPAKLIIDDKETRNAGILAVDFPSEVKSGFSLDAGRLPEGANEAVIGYHFRDLFSDGESAEGWSAKEWLGRTVQIGVSQFFNEIEETTTMEVTVVGVAKAPSREWQMDNSLYIGEETLVQIEQFTQSLFGAMNLPDMPEEHRADFVKPLSAPREYNNVLVYADKVNNVKDISGEIRDAGYLNHSIANELEQVNMVFLIMKIGLIFVGTIAVLIASIGIYNTMTMAVTERAQDIGIMKAIGAHPSTIRQIFLIESTYIGVLGALIGTIVSYVISKIVNIGLPIIIENFMHEKVPNDFVFSYIPLYLTAICIVISLGVAMLSGSGPAKRATKVDVLKAMRRDI